MSGGKRKRQIGKLVELLRTRYDASSIYVEDIADCLEYPQNVVEDELHLLYEKGILEPAWELHCGLCGSVVTSYELPNLFRKGLMVGPCPGCLSWLETEDLSEDDLVMVYQFAENETEMDWMCNNFAEIPKDSIAPEENDVISDWEGEIF